MAETLNEPLLGEWRGRRRDGVAGKVLRACTNFGKDPQNKFARFASVKQNEGSESFLWRALAPFRNLFSRFKLELNNVALPVKAGLVAAVCSLLCFVSGPLSVLNKNGVWAVVTADVVLDANVGLTFSKGINRTLGTLAAALLALGVNYSAPKLGKYEPYFVVGFTFLGGVFPTMFKFRRPFKDRWNYAVAMSMITFHILILSKSEYKDKIRLPLIRLVTIIIGFLVASLVNLSVAPTFAGETINELVSKNLERAGNVMERCVTAYCAGEVLDQVSDILAGKSAGDNIHMSFHEIVSADSEVEKLMKAVPFEPCHGKFFFGFPWDMYADITDNLRYTLYDVVALDSCLRAEIQAPLHLRHIFEEEFQSIGKECSQVLRLLGQSLRTMRHIGNHDVMERAEEGTLILQHKIAKYTSTLLGAEEFNSQTPVDVDKPKDVDEDNELFSVQDLDGGISESTISSRTVQSHADQKNASVDVHPKLLASHFKEGHEQFLERRESIGRHLDVTVQRISALSLIKFASLLIELVAKAKYLVTIVDELEVKAHFDEEPEENSVPKVGYQGV